MAMQSWWEMWYRAEKEHMKEDGDIPRTSPVTQRSLIHATDDTGT